MTLTEFHELAVSVCRKYMPEIDPKIVVVHANGRVNGSTYWVSLILSGFDVPGLYDSPSAALAALEAELQKRNTLNNISKQQEDIKID